MAYLLSFGILLLISACGGGDEFCLNETEYPGGGDLFNLNENEYPGLSGKYSCIGQGLFSVQPLLLVELTARDQSAILKAEATNNLARHQQDSGGFPLYTDAISVGLYGSATVISFSLDNKMQLVYGRVNEIKSLKITATYVGSCSKI